ncbi:hypothetical protein AG1IA_10413 [Rhizoctonia solani AG-1 IA]|uniref:Uncharacterized protein n=1 Tax=Thanatephorus cucumeris (strain AG1-IA) TaxID=983506 RepID=L8WFQ9_THACA|nr:hypothetical protein AG1IA_10413 [Rhizoctonia solani AG-1 IA]
MFDLSAVWIGPPSLVDKTNFKSYPFNNLIARICFREQLNWEVFPSCSLEDSR